MISHAQNFEDVMLERAFGEVEDGFWVDVGAWDPDVDSVTRHFYDRGWRGVNIEPNPKYLALLKSKRQRDVNLGVAVGAQAGRAAITLIHGTGMSTLNPDIAAGHSSLGYEQEVIDVELRSLNSIFDEYAQQEVHFLKIDCEGAEAEVINAFDLRKMRPWIILVEATKPLSREQTHGAWEPHLLANDYEFAYFDGVNRFYVAAEHADLKRHFEIPPNIFDSFIVARMMIPSPESATRQKQGLIARLASFFTGPK